jgi:hypothetical protein
LRLSLAPGDGSSRPVPLSPLAQSVRLKHGCALLVAVLRDPDEFASPAVGVGNCINGIVFDPIRSTGPLGDDPDPLA